MTLTGIYSPDGYTIESDDGQELYQAGNHRQDSTSFADPGSCDALPLAMIRKICERTLAEMCRERRAVYGGVRHARFARFER